MEKDELVKQLCAQFCFFYKPGKDEELACRGFHMLEKLLDERKKVPARAEKIIINDRIEGDLFHAICKRCPFFEQDCDFAAWKRGESEMVTRDAVHPCGGLLCLGQCIEHGTIDIQDINRVI